MAMEFDPKRDPKVLLDGLHASEAKSWYSGGTAQVLPAERAKASFSVDSMATILDGDKKKRMKKNWINNSSADFTGPVVDSRKYDLDRSEAVGLSLKNFMDIHKPHFDKGYLPEDYEIAMMNAASIMGGYPGYGLFMITVLQQSSTEQLSWWALPTMQCKITGCYAQTELGHGSNVRGLETTAHYDAATETFVLNTPTLTSMKFWPSSMVSATHAAVYAQLIIGSKNYGVHSFMVQLRDEMLRPFPGIEVGDIGTKAGEPMIDIGYLRLKDVRIPRTCLFAKRQHVEKDGTYVKHVSKSKGKGGEKMQYLTMMQARASMVGGASSALAKGVTIAIRYSLVRRQGFKDTKAGIDYASDEYQIIDYKMTQYRLLKQLAFAVGNRFVFMWLNTRKAAIQAALGSAEEGQDNADDLPELHASSAGLKGLCCDRASIGIEDCRKACGGAGYLLASGIAALEADYKWRSTAEGDTVVMLLQTARFLIRSLADAREGRRLSGLTSCLSVAGKPGFNALKDCKPVSPTTSIGWHDLQFLASLLEYRTIVSCCAADEQLQARISAGKAFDEAWQSLTLTMAKLGEAHVIYFMFCKFKETVDAIKDEACKVALTRLCALFGLSEVADGSQWAGLLSAADSASVDDAISQLCDVLRPDAVAFTDAFEFPDHVLNSTIGRADGNVYEAQYSAAVQSPLNKQEVPAWLEAMRPYLDFKLLALRNGEKGAANYLAPQATASKL